MQSLLGTGELSPNTKTCKEHGQFLNRVVCNGYFCQKRGAFRKGAYLKKKLHKQSRTRSLAWMAAVIALRVLVSRQLSERERNLDAHASDLAGWRHSCA
jgi:hypothetical protein